MSDPAQIRLARLSLTQKLDDGQRRLEDLYRARDRLSERIAASEADLQAFEVLLTSAGGRLYPDPEPAPVDENLP